MSDLEDRLRSLEFRAPPQDIRRSVLAAVKPGRTWREWLWPSPLAWGMVAVVWVIAFATMDSDDTGPQSRAVAHFAPSLRILKTADIDRILSQQ